ncbi:MAG: transketolase C-terminal domain-containing protein [Candidatus Desulfatibia sp.]|uniref:transketolase family protein n=1 Tax=Candidatus Desulfatibia sp. TaxID=3101189 RepID=UPI002F2C3129
MRIAFFKSLLETFKADEDTYFLTGDLGYILFDELKAAAPERFYNIGVAEANMVGISTGLALCGKSVYCYSIAPFLVMRAYEQIRNGIAGNRLNVKLVGAGGGFAYGKEGLTHFALEDISLMRALPGMTVVVPADPVEAGLLATQSHQWQTPMYIRLGKTGEKHIHETPPEFIIGKGMTLLKGKDVAIIAAGTMVQRSLEAAGLLRKKGVSASVINMHTIKPMDAELVQELSQTHEAIFTVEEHNINGGLGSAVAELLAESSYNGLFRRIGIPDELKREIGDGEYLRGIYGLNPEGIFNTITKALK